MRPADYIMGLIQKLILDYSPELIKYEQSDASGGHIILINPSSLFYSESFSKVQYEFTSLFNEVFPDEYLFFIQNEDVIQFKNPYVYTSPFVNGFESFIANFGPSKVICKYENGMSVVANLSIPKFKILSSSLNNKRFQMKNYDGKDFISFALLVSNEDTESQISFSISNSSSQYQKLKIHM